MDDRTSKNLAYARELRKLKPDVRAAASESLMNILEGVSQFCLEHGFGKSEVEAALQRSLVSQARKNCKLQGREPNVSRLAVITGITRKRVKEIRLELDRQVGLSFLPAGKLVRLVDTWRTDSAFLDESGCPRALDFSGPRQGEFGALSRDAAGDIPPTALLRELERMGAVQKTDNHVELVSHELLAKRGDDDGLLAIRIAGDAIQDFLATINNNLSPDAQPMLERRVVAEFFSEKELEEFRIFAEGLTREFLEKLNQWILDRQASAEPETQTSDDAGRQARAGLGVYFFHNESTSEMVE